MSRSPHRRRVWARLAIVAAAAALLGVAAAPAAADYGDGFGVGAAQGPAFPGPDAIWAGTCDLADPTAAVGTPPTHPMHCIDVGTSANQNAANAFWTIPPSWRLGSVAQAGAHPDATTTFWLNRGAPNPLTGFPGTEGNVKNVDVALPPGLIGNPTAVPRCPAEAARTVPPSCPANTQVGVATNVVQGAAFAVENLPIYNMEPRAGITAEFLIAATAKATNIPIVAKVRDGGDYGVTASVAQIPAGAPVFSATITLWGDPWNGAHDRFRPASSDAYFNSPGLLLDNNVQSWGIPPTGLPPADRATYDPSWGPRSVFWSNPTECTGAPLSVGIGLTQWQKPTTVLPFTIPQDPVTGCDQVPFAGSLDVAPASTQAGASTGYAFDMSIPQSSDAGTLATGQLKKATVVLPVGVRVNPSSASGLGGCTLAQANLGSENDVDCPDSSKIGTLSIDTPLLPDPLQGDIYLAQPHDNKFDSLLSLILVARGPGIIVKIPGRIDPDPVTGQLTATFDDNPQLPFSKLHLQFTDGPRAPLSNPPTCGTKTTHTTLTSWSGKTVTSDSSFQITGCSGPRGFAPTFTAGTTNPLAGAFSPFTMTFARTDLDQEFDSVTVHMPSGLLGMISSVPLCDAGPAADGSCPAASRVGSTTVSAGAGPEPLWLKGDVYIAGPYKGAPFSLSIVVDTKGQAGPFDLGKVVVRAPINVDAAHAKLDVPSDPFPRILQGIPLQMRSVNITLDRPGFVFNATSCDAQQVGVQLNGTDGGVWTGASPYQAQDCGRLPFAPKMTARTKGTVTFKQGAEFHVNITQQPGEAAIKSVSVLLPKQLPSRLIPTINNACVSAVFEQDETKCPEDSYIGTAVARTPVFPDPMIGQVFVVARPNDVPQLVVHLHGQGIATGIDLKLYADIIVDDGGGRSRSTFHMVPDVPITSFQLDLPSGPHSILDAPSDDLCRQPMSMNVTEIAQSGKRIDTEVPIAVSDCPTFAKVKVIRKPRYDGGKGGGYLKVSVKVPTAGTVQLSGKGIWPSSRFVIRKGGYLVRARVTAAMRARLAKDKKAPFAVKVRFQPGNAPKASTATTRATVRR